MDDKRLRIIFIIIICLVIIRGMIYGLVLPFDGAPDERHHFELIKAKQMQLLHASEDEKLLVAAQIEVTWRSLISPESPAEKHSLQNIIGTVYLPDPPDSSQLTESPLYYFFTAKLLNVLELKNIRNEIYLLRRISVLCGGIVVFFSILVARQLFPGNGFLLVGVPTFIAFIPQFSAMNGSINNDKFAEIFAALLFWVIVKTFEDGMSVAHILAFLGAMGAAFLGKRTAIALFPLLLVFIFLYYWKFSLGVWMHIVIVVGLFALILGGYALLWNQAFYNFIDEYLIDLPPISYLKNVFLRPELISPEFLKYYAKFFTVIYWSFWGIFGYMTIHIHHFWYIAAACVHGLACCGLVRGIIQAKRRIFNVEQWAAKALYLFFVSVILVLLIPFLRSIVFRPNDPVLTQGRYLFIAVLPISVLTVFGLAQLFPPKYHRLVGAASLLGLLVLDSVCLMEYILLNFHFRSLF